MVIVRRIIVFIAIILLALSIASPVRAQGPTVVVLTVDGTIVPVIADYLDQGIRHAEEINAAVCVIELDTPGGLLGSTEKIVQRILNANVPVVVYVSPKGAWAASAGTFITLAANFAVMTPGTTIGAAHPVAGGDQQLSDAEMQKITEFSAKWMKTIAETRGRNIEEAQLAVTESKSFTDTEALSVGLIDFRADTLDQVLSEINGREITLSNGAKLTINTSGYQLLIDGMSVIEKFLQAISDSNIAYILLSVATLGIMAEIFNPGLIFPGVVGGICLLMAFYSLGVLPVNYAGVLLIVLAVGLFIAEVFTSGFGLLFGGGIVALILGSLILFQGAAPVFRVDPWLIAVVVIILAGCIGFLAWRAIQIHRKQPATGREELIGKTATVKVALDPEGMVFYRGENWRAISESGDIMPGEEVTIERVDSLTLYVKRK